MAVCIYCKVDSSSSVSVPHAFPQGLAQNRLVLPVGVECDRCNQYAGRRLDENLIRYPVISVAIQIVGAPGKKGKTRSLVGGIRRERVDSKSVRVGLKLRGRISLDPKGRVAFEGHVPPVPQFDFLRFRRALHHIGLNMVASQQGTDAALEPKYDRVRQYVRNPSPPTDSWPYGQIERKLKAIPRVIAGQFIEVDGVELVGIYIFQVLFLVDLLRTGVLEHATQAMGGVFVPAQATEPPPTVIAGGGRLQP
jgi:hypothetical protein